MSSPSTFITQDETRLIKSWKVNRDGSCKILSRASLRRPPVICQVLFTVLSLHINNIFAKKKGIAKKLTLTLRAIMISQHFDLVAGDVNGTAWRCLSRDNLSSIDEAFILCALPTPPGPTPL